MTPLTGLIIISSRTSVGRTRFRTKRKTIVRFAAESHGHEPSAGDIAAWEGEGGTDAAPYVLKCSQVQLMWRVGER